MEQVIIYPTESGGVAVVMPITDSGLTIEEIAAKDVPEGVPSRIIAAADLPPRETRARWRWTDIGPLGVADPEPEPVPQELSFAQMLIGLVAEGWITQAEGEAWLGGTVPGPVSALIGQLPVAQRFAALARAVRPSVVLRSDPLVSGLAALQGKTDAQMDDFFRAYSRV